MSETNTEVIKMVAKDAQDAAEDAQAAEDVALHAESVATEAASDAREALEHMEAVTEAVAEEKASTEFFELFTAILLGLGATLGGVAGHQGGLWGGKSVECFSEASTLTTQAAEAAGFANSLIAHDNHVNVQAMQIIWKAQQTPPGEDRDFYIHQASVLYLRQASDEAYDALKLPADSRKTYQDLGIEDIPEKDLVEVQRREFGPEYYEAMYKESEKRYAEAKALFEQGRTVGGVGDNFSLSGVYFSLSLFFAGLSLVFKSRMRWSFFGVGLLILIGTSIFMYRLEWA